MYNFDSHVERRGTASLKWDIGEHELPMWVADMDFAVLPQITDAIMQRAASPVYGYNIIPDEWYDSYIDWWRELHGYGMKREWLLFSTGAVPSLSSIVRRLTRPGEKVLLQTPVYNIFFNSIINNGRFAVESCLKVSEGEYCMDLDDLERKMSDPMVTLMVLCNPQNPVGKIWQRDELCRVAELAEKYGVVVVSDEIHCDLTHPGHEYVPYQSVSESARLGSVMLMSVTKAFNIAGIQTSAICIPDPALRHQVNRGINNDEIAEPNTFAICTAVAALRYGREWNRELREYILANKQTVTDYLRENIPALRPYHQDCTYLMWIDCSEVCPDSVELTRYIREKTGLFVSEGAEYGECGRHCMRLNVACPRDSIMEGMKRLRTGIELYQKEHN